MHVYLQVLVQQMENSKVAAFGHLNKASDMLKYLAELCPKMWGKNFTFLQRDIDKACGTSGI